MGILLGWIALRTGSVRPHPAFTSATTPLSVSLGRKIRGIEIFTGEKNYHDRIRLMAGPQYDPIWTACALFVFDGCWSVCIAITAETDPIEKQRRVPDRVVGDGTAWADPVDWKHYASIVESV